MSTSLQRTYRALRLAVIALVVVIFTSVGLATVSVGWLPSISDYYFSPARTSFTGALIGVSLALLVLSGRGIERALIDAAALFAPLIALIPTTGTHCLPRCAPTAFAADAANGIVTYLIVGAVGIVTVAMLAGWGQVSWAAAAPTGGLAVAVLLTLGLLWTFVPDVVLAHGHVVATVIFFALFAAVAVVHAFRARPFRAAYITVGALLVLVLIAYAAFFPRSVLIAEVAALMLFAAFWILQSIEKWNDPDPSAR